MARKLAMLQWGHGSKTVESLPLWHPYPTAASFNGATVRKPWKGIGHTDYLHSWPALQWGHGSKTVERLRAPFIPVHRIMLQWGHGSKTVESVSARV